MSQIARELRSSPPAIHPVQEKQPALSEAGGTGKDIEALAALNAQLTARVAQLQTALNSRIVIEQAKGILAAHLDVSVDEAFELLRRAARSDRIKLHDLAAEAVAARAVPPKVVRLLFAGATQCQLGTAAARRSRSFHLQAVRPNQRTPTEGVG